MPVTYLTLNDRPIEVEYEVDGDNWHILKVIDDESGEGDTMVVERERDLALSAKNRETVQEIDDAVKRIANGTYGYSQLTGLPIPKEPRLSISSMTGFSEARGAHASLRWRWPALAASALCWRPSPLRCAPAQMPMPIRPNAISPASATVCFTLSAAFLPARS